MDIIERQTNTAIELLLAKGDSVSIYSLAYAALRVARDLAKAQNSRRHYEFETLIEPSKAKQFYKALGRNANFFKHADDDPFDY